ncbi:MAG: caffeoyl-CoA O-methyltransferase [Actinomycetota bacterium]|nr:caffeoyl-CoA O-methyltransferase [Actinomycetota bacterium]
MRESYAGTDTRVRLVCVSCVAASVSIVPAPRPPKSFLLSSELSEYIVSHGTPPDEVQQKLIEETAELGAVAGMQIAPEQGAFLTVLARLIGARRAIEIGTFTGYSALCIARGLPADGRLVCCDVSEEWTQIGRRAWAAAGVADRIDLRIAPALETLAALANDETFDLAFIDADKPNYLGYYEALLPRIRTNGAILVDNVLWDGNVVKPDADDENTRAIRAFNDRVAADDRVDVVMLPIADGLTLARKR